jgi:hypothetical protein
MSGSLVPSHALSPGRLQILAFMSSVFSVFPETAGTFGCLLGEVSPVSLHLALRTLNAVQFVLLLLQPTFLLLACSSALLSPLFLDTLTGSTLVLLGLLMLIEWLVCIGPGKHRGCPLAWLMKSLSTSL